MGVELRMPLTKQWFEMSKTVKKEDYREITPYWIKRLFDCKHPEEEKGENKNIPEDIIYDIFVNGYEPNDIMKTYFCEPKKFDTNVMTLGYPKTGDEEKILRFEHKGIEIRTGKPEWGAEEGKLYFVVMHGDKCVKNYKVIDHEEVLAG